MLLLDIFCCLEVIIRMQAAGLFIFQWQPRDCISADRSQEAGLGLRPRLRQDVLPSASVSSCGKGEGWLGLDEFFGSFNTCHAMSLYSRDLKLIPCRFWREMYHSSVTCPPGHCPSNLDAVECKDKDCHL